MQNNVPEEASIMQNLSGQENRHKFYASYQRHLTDSAKENSLVIQRQQIAKNELETPAQG